MYIISGLITLCGLCLILYGISNINFALNEPTFVCIIIKTIYVCDGKKWHKIVGPYETGPHNNKIVKHLPLPTFSGDTVEIHSIPLWAYLKYK